VHFFLVRALQSAGLDYADVQTVFLPPADARAAFERGSVDAWVIWDPFLAAAEAATQARTLASGIDLVANYQFYLADRNFAVGHAAALQAVLDAISEIDTWAKHNTDGVAAELAPSVGIPAPILAVALSRQSFGVQPLDERVIAYQQGVAETFLKLGLIPKPIVVVEAVRPGS
jgi:sulfonate transport system substrate-binding protein